MKHNDHPFTPCSVERSRWYLTVSRVRVQKSAESIKATMAMQVSAKKEIAKSIPVVRSLRMSDS